MITAFLPIRKGSQRVINKNFRQFSHYKYGIYELKIKQLLGCSEIDKVIVSTTDEMVYEVGIAHPKLEIIPRPQHLGLATTKTDDLVKYALGLVDSEWFLWTHVTSPLFDESHYSNFIKKSVATIEGDGYDSAVSVTELKSYLFKSDLTPIFDRENIKWPATQSLEPIYEINNAAFFGKTETLRTYNDRLGENPYFYECQKLEATDIDWECDFHLAELLHDGLLNK